MPASSQQVEWLSLVETTGPFLTVQVMEQAFPQGLDSIETPRRQQLRAAYYEWRDAVDEDDELLPQLHKAWINLVLTELLEYDAESLTPASAWTCELPPVAAPDDASATFTPSWIIHAPASGAPRLFVTATAPGTRLDSAANPDGWLASQIERMTLLCRAHGVRLGLVTNGEAWVLVNAPSDSPSGQTTWYSRYWFQEPATFKAFQSLLGVRRCFGPTAGTLEALLDESLKHQEEVTDTLGEQVRRATEVLIQALDKADEDRNRELLRDVPPTMLYEASLTVMMRLVFVLCAEERGLFLLGDPAYDTNLAVSTLRGQLTEAADQHGEELLERRYDAWARLLTVFRSVYGGIEHEDLRLPAMGGSLFDPDRYPFLEGRDPATSWLDTPARPLPIDNRTVLLLLNSLQVLESRRGALALSYRALDVEQIGHVYEGLLDHTVIRLPDVTLGLEGSAKNRYPSIALSELESLRIDGEAKVAAKVATETGRSGTSIRNDLARPIPDAIRDGILTAVGGNTALADRIAPFANLIRTDAWNDPIIYRANSFMVTSGTERRETGTHYTPRSLTEQIVNVALEPVVYIGPSEGKPQSEWQLKTPEALLDIKVCDPAMGSGAFLVQACRYIADRLAEAWAHAESNGKAITADGEVVDTLRAADPLPTQADERLNTARRLVAQRCLYGVDINPLAVELAKLSIWLVTLAEGKPFGFLDHNLRSGDSLLGIHRIEQLVQMRLNPKPETRRQAGLLDAVTEEAIQRANDIRLDLRSRRERDIIDVLTRAALDQEARQTLLTVNLVADAFIHEVFRVGPKSKGIDSACDSLALTAAGALSGAEPMIEEISRKVTPWSKEIENDEANTRNPFHWSIEFPEVMENGGFDAVFGNPPFVDSETMSRNDPTLREFLSSTYATTRGNWDLYIPFIERAFSLAKRGAPVFLLSPNKWLSAPYGSTLRAMTADRVRHILDYSRGRAFPNAGVAAICVGFEGASPDPVQVQTYLPGSIVENEIPRQWLFRRSDWGFLLSRHVKSLMEIAATEVKVGDFAMASDPFTVSEAYQLRDWIMEYPATGEFFMFINTGTVDPFVSLWGSTPVRYLKTSFQRPIVLKSDLERLLPRRFAQASSPKLILSGMRKFEAFMDVDGSYVAGKSSVIVMPLESIDVLPTLLGIFNSDLMRFYVQEAFGALGVDGGISFSGGIVEQLPLPMGFNGGIAEIESAVNCVLDAVGDDSRFISAMNSLNEAVLNAYGASDELRNTIYETEIKC